MPIWEAIAIAIVSALLFIAFLDVRKKKEDSPERHALMASVCFLAAIWIALSMIGDLRTALTYSVVCALFTEGVEEVKACLKHKPEKNARQN